MRCPRRGELFAKFLLNPDFRYPIGISFGELIKRYLADGSGQNTQLPFIDLLR
jgi:hypothetical protein